MGQAGGLRNAAASVLPTPGQEPLNCSQGLLLILFPMPKQEPNEEESGRAAWSLHAAKAATTAFYDLLQVGVCCLLAARVVF